MDWKWQPAKIKNGSASEWRANGVRIVAVINAAGMTNYDVKFPNGKECRQFYLHEAQQYARDHFQQVTD